MDRPRATGAITINDMRFKIDKNLEKMVAAMDEPMAIETASAELFRPFVKAGLIHESSELVGKTPLQAMANESVFAVCAVLARIIGVRWISGDLFDTFISLKIID